MVLSAFTKCCWELLPDAVSNRRCWSVSFMSVVAYSSIFTRKSKITFVHEPFSDSPNKKILNKSRFFTLVLFKPNPALLHILTWKWQDLPLDSLPYRSALPPHPSSDRRVVGGIFRVFFLFCYLKRNNIYYIRNLGKQINTKGYHKQITTLGLGVNSSCL